MTAEEKVESARMRKMKREAHIRVMEYIGEKRKQVNKEINDAIMVGIKKGNYK